MSLTLKVHNKDFPNDHEFAISGLGVFTNGKGREVTKEEEQAFVTERYIAVRDAFENDPNVEVSGTATAKVPDMPKGWTLTPEGWKWEDQSTPAPTAIVTAGEGGAK